MSNTPHKWSDVIKAWADGYTIQSRRFILARWSDWMDFPENFEPIVWDDPDVEFRIKPTKVVKYRLAVIKHFPNFYPVVVFSENFGNVRGYLLDDFETSKYFVKWLSEEQYLEVKIDD